MLFTIFMALFVIFLIPFGEIFQNFTVHWIRCNTNFKQEKSSVFTGSFLDFCKFMSFIAAEKLVR